MNRTRKSIAAAAAFGSILAGGAAGIVAFGHAANAADSTTTTQPAASGAAPSDSTRPAPTPQTALTGDDLAKATAAVEAAVPGATIVRAESDADGIHVHITKADGTAARVVLNADFTVKSVDADQGPGGGGAPNGPHQANGITETPLTGDELAKATAAANTAAPGATIVRAETDADGDAFEVHITKADGTKATVKLNTDFSVKAVEADQGPAGGGHGGPGGRGHGGGPRGGQAPSSSSGSATTPTTTN